jgi:hypothetical protein
MDLIQEYTRDDTKAHLILQLGYAFLVILLESLSFHVRKPFFLADHDYCTLRTAYHVSAFLLPEIDTRSDHGWSGTASHGDEIFPDVCSILDDPESKLILAPGSSSRRKWTMPL